MQTTKFTGLIVTLATLAAPAMASSHMDAPLITLDDAANTTDVYAFVGKDPAGRKALQMAVSVYPFEDPGIGPNKYDFDDRVLYALHVATGKDVARGLPTISYFFEFQTSYKTKGTILQSYLGVINDVDDANQNRTQRYAVTRVSSTGVVRLGSGVVPPNNQGIATPEYNTAQGEGLAKIGVDSASKLDKYTRQTVASLATGHYSWCGQREDGFYGDIQAVFDLLQLRGKGAARDSQRGFNVHTINLSVPMAQLGGDMQQVGVWATTYRKTFTVRIKSLGDIEVGDWVQIGRQGNPLFCEAFVAIADKDLYNRCPPSDDPLVFKKYADSPELAKLLNAIVFKGNPIPGIETNRSDLVGIFIPDVIKVDLSTNPVPLAGGGPNHVTTPDDPGYSRLSIFGGDTSHSPLAQSQVPSGWPNGRRFGDDVIDIGVSAVISDLRTSPPVIRLAGDNVDANDAVYNKVFPYGGVPHNGRNHRHD